MQRENAQPHGPQWTANLPHRRLVLRQRNVRVWNKTETLQWCKTLPKLGPSSSHLSLYLGLGIYVRSSWFKEVISISRPGAWGRQLCMPGGFLCWTKSISSNSFIQQTFDKFPLHAGLCVTREKRTRVLTPEKLTLQPGREKHVIDNLIQHDKATTAVSTKWHRLKRRQLLFCSRCNWVGSTGQTPFQLGHEGWVGVYQDRSGKDDGEEKAER